MHALGVAQYQAWVGGGSHVGAELAGQSAGAGVHTLVLDVTRAVDGDVLAVAGPWQAGDAHRAFDFRQRMRWANDIGRLADRSDLDAVVAGVLVAGLDRPAQGAGLAIVGIAVDAQGFGYGRRGGEGRQGEQWQQGHEHRHQTHGGRVSDKSLFLLQAVVCGGF
ncbi:hypothetical protein D3C81_1632210 [compost metagenome]